jgi:hypothetical protein
VLQSATGSFFYLSYRTFTGIQQVLLIINNLALRSSAPISDDDLIRVPAPPAIEPSNNYITLDCSALNANSFIVSTLFLKSVAHRPPSVQYLINNASTIREDYYLSREDSTFLFFPKESGWFSLLTDDNSLLRVDDLEGQGDDRFIETNDGLFYIAIGEEMDTNLLRQSMGVISRRPPGFSRDNVIRLSAKVIR